MASTAMLNHHWEFCGPMYGPIPANTGYSGSVSARPYRTARCGIAGARASEARYAPTSAMTAAATIRVTRSSARPNGLATR